MNDGRGEEGEVGGKTLLISIVPLAPLLFAYVLSPPPCLPTVVGQRGNSEHKCTGHK